MEKRYLLLYCLLTFIFASWSRAQLQLPYECDFENPKENAHWQLNYNPYISIEPNQWYIGKAVNNGGQHALYVSNDQGKTNHYTVSPNTLLAIREFTLPVGTYQLGFDWRSLGLDCSCLYVCWIPQSESRILSLKSSNLPLFIEQYALNIGKKKALYNSTSWESETLSFNSDGTPHRLVFAWYDNGSLVLKNPPSAIDNVQIALDQCSLVDHFTCKMNGSVAKLSWHGSADSYDIRYRHHDSKQWSTILSLKKNTVDVSLLKNGLYTFAIRSNCGTKKSIWKTWHHNIIYQASCINYLDLKSALCTYGTKQQPDQTVSLVDYGPQSPLSHHTIHYDPNEYDERTGNQLKVVPNDAFAVVRIGNWEKANGETIRYKYHVGAQDNRILLLKYAIVFDNPHHPTKEEQPEFIIEIRDDKDELIDHCGYANFYAQSNQENWHTYKAPGQTGDSVVWKDWTTLGLNLSQYANQDITIYIQVSGCIYSAHYGYAYFTLDCDDGLLKGINCGSTPTSYFEAPLGFHYKWYKKGDVTKQLVDDYPTDDKQANRLSINPSDTTKYCVDIINKKYPDCYYTLEACAIPRFPKAKNKVTIDRSNCHQRLILEDQSYVETRELHIKKDGSYEFIHPRRSALAIDSRVWDINGTLYTGEKVIIDIPDKGGDYLLKYTVGVNNGACSDIKDTLIHIPSIGSQKINIDTTLCLGDYYQLGLRKLTKSGDYIDTLKTHYGCDSIISLKLDFYPSQTTCIYDTICSGESYHFGSHFFSNSGHYQDRLVDVKGCDSLVDLHLQVLPKFSASFEYPQSVCADDAIWPFEMHQIDGKVDSVKLYFSKPIFTNGKQAKLPFNTSAISLKSTLEPNEYSGYMVCYDPFCGNDTMPMILDVLYSSSIIEQKWNNVLSLLNAHYNGGYDFIHYQWYCNGVKLEGENHSYLYLGRNKKFDVKDSYSVKVQRKSDLSQLFSCPIFPIKKEDKYTSIQIVVPRNNQPIQVVTPFLKGTIVLFDMSGRRVYDCPIHSKYTNIPLKLMKGIYIIQIHTSQIIHTEKIVIN